MPLPRFTRLPEPERNRILATATRHIAERGLDGISLHDLAEAAGISRSALYNYFDGRDDLISAATAAAVATVAETLGTWEPQPNEAAFWEAFDAASHRLRTLLATRPELRRLLAGAADAADPWVDAFFADALRLGLVTTDSPLARVATGAVIAAADALELAEPGSTSSEELQQLLRRLWS